MGVWELINRTLYILSLFSGSLCIQEHLLLNSGDRKHSNTNKLKKYFGETHDMYIVRIVPVFKEDTVVKPGRGKGGSFNNVEERTHN